MERNPIFNGTPNLIIKQKRILGVKLAKTRICGQLRAQQQTALGECVVLSHMQLPQSTDLLRRYAVPREQELLLIQLVFASQQSLAVVCIEHIRLQIGDRCVCLLCQHARHMHIIDPEIVVMLSCLVQTQHHIR